MEQVALGIDIGGTNTVFGFVERKGNIICESQIKTQPKDSDEVYFGRLFPAIEELSKKLPAGYEWIGTGIGAPNANYYKGTVELPPNLNWHIVDVVKLFREKFSLPAFITNDANAAAIGEMIFGAARGINDFIIITLGTGLGSGIVSGGKLIYGHDGFAGELGHVVIKEDGRDCGCGRKGCLETYASATGICRTVFELLCNRTTESSLRNIPFSSLSARQIYDAAVAGDVIALEAFEYTGTLLGKALANSVTFSSPALIVLFGGLAAAGEFILRPTYKAMEENMLNIFKNKVKIVLSQLPESNAALLGAAALFWSEYNKH